MAHVAIALASRPPRGVEDAHPFLRMQRQHETLRYVRRCIAHGRIVVSFEATLRRVPCKLLLSWRNWRIPRGYIVSPTHHVPSKLLHAELVSIAPLRRVQRK